MYQEVLYNSAYKILLNDDDVADCLQETEIRAWEKIRNLRNESAFNSWIFKIMLNLAKDMLKNQVRTVVFEEERYVETILDNHEKLNIDQALNKLPENYKIPLILYYYAGFSIKEIAKQLSITKNTVKIRLSRGRLQIKKLLEELNND